MMKVIYEEETYCFPTKRNLNFLVDNEYKENFISCLSNYFGKKKKNACKVFNDDGVQILYDELEFIYLPYAKTSIEQNFHFSAKSLLNAEFTKIIEINMEYFTSIDRIREDMHDLLTDLGMNKLKQLLSKYTNDFIDINSIDFDISKLVEMLSIDIDTKTADTFYMALYNLLIYLNREKNSLIYIDFPVTQKVLEWMKEYAKDGLLFIIDNCFEKGNYDELESCSLISMSNKDFLECIHYELSEFPFISYMFTPFVQQYIELQNEKIMEYYTQLHDHTTTFYLMFDKDNTQITDK